MSFSFRTWPFPSSKKNNHILKCSKYGLIAHAMNNNVSVFFEEFGHFTPLIMWSPFQHQITAMEWYDASKTMNTAVPVLVVASISGRLEVFDCRSRISILNLHINQHSSNISSNIIYPTALSLTHLAANSRRENDYATSIFWTPFSSSSFYVGTKNGRLIRFEITIGQIVKCRVEWELFFNFQIDHICIEPQFGEICAVASEKGSIATIQNINDYQPGKPPVASPDVVSLSIKTDSIKQIEFYPTSTDFLMLVTTSTSLLYSINECCTAPLLMFQGIQRFHILHDTENLILIVLEDSVQIWKSIDEKSKMISEIKLVVSPKSFNTKEILVSDMIGNKLIMLTSKMWLTTVELKSSNKLFITHRVKLLDSKPLSFSYANESITFSTENGSILISEKSDANFIAQMGFDKKIEQKKIEKSDTKNDSKSSKEQNNNNNDNNDNDNNKDESQINLELSKLISVSKSQDIKLYKDDQKTLKNKANKVRNSIVKSCASSSSLFHDSIGDSDPQEEILDKSIIYNDKRQTIINDSILLPNIPIKVERKRRFSMEAFSKGSFLSSLASERIKAMPKDSTSAITQSPFKPVSQSTSNLTVKTDSILLKETNMSSSILAPIETSSSEIKNATFDNSSSDRMLAKEDPKNSPVSSRVIPKNKYGNNCSIMWNYEISNDLVIEKVDWISSTRILAYTLAKVSYKKDDNEESPRLGNRKLSDSNDSSDSSNRLDNEQRFSGKSFVYLIDLKYHSIRRLFDKPGINVTDIVFSGNKQYFFVILNGLMLVLFRNKQQPQRVRSLTFQKPIFAAFSHRHLIAIDINGEITLVTITEKDESMKEKKLQMRLKKENGKVTCICGVKNLIYFGTSAGSILCIDVNTMKISERYKFKESIKSIKSGPSGSFLIEDCNSKMIAISSSDDEITKLPMNTKYAILTSPTILLIRRKNRNSVEVYQTVGHFSSSYPKAAYRCPLMMPTHRWIQSLVKEDPIDQNVLINYGMISIASLMDARKSPKFTHEKISFLRNLIMETPQLWKTSYRLSIFLGDFEKAHSIIESNTKSDIASNNDKWAINLMKGILFNKKPSNESESDGVLFVAKNLIEFGFFDDGVDVFLSAGLWIEAVNLLMKIGKYQTAAVITRVYRDDKTIDVVKDVALKLLKVPNMISYALAMLCEVGLEKDAIDELEKINQFYSSYILKMVSENENI